MGTPSILRVGVSGYDLPWHLWYIGVFNTTSFPGEFSIEYFASSRNLFQRITLSKR